MSSFNASSVGRRVRAERQKAGLSLSQLAEQAGLTKAYLVRLETQGGNPSLDSLVAIADALELTVADLLDRPRLVLDDETEIPGSLRAYAEDARLSSVEVRQLASIKWRAAERPHTVERWRFIHQSLRASRSLEEQTDDK